MAKRSQKRLPRHERSEPGCMWNLMSLFQARSTKRLLTDRSREAKQGVGSGRSCNQKILPRPAEACENAADVEESRTPTASVKELMAVEMFNEQGFMNQLNDSETKPEQTGLKHAKRNQARKKRNRVKSSDMDVLELDAVEFLCESFGLAPEQTNVDNLDLEMVVEELVRISRRDTTCLKNDSHGALNVPSCGQDVEKLISALKLVLNERRSCVKSSEEGRNAFRSKEFADAQQMLSSNKSSLLKLLRDQNSVLVKHFQKLVDAHVDKDQNRPPWTAPDLPEKKPTSLKSGDLSNHKHWSFFRRSKSLDSYPMEWDKDCLSPNKIVILRPGQEGAQSPETCFSVSSSSVQDNKAAHESQNLSYFSFTGIKRKLWNAMGKEIHMIPPSLKLSPKEPNGKNGCKISLPGESSGWSSPNRNHFYTERFAISSPIFKKGELASKFRDKGSSVPGAKTFQYQKLRGLNIYNEAKKHLSDMLKNRDENIESMEGQFSKSLGRTLSLPEHNGSSCLSPRMSTDDIFAAAEVRLSQPGLVKNNSSGHLQEHVNDYASPRNSNLESPRCSSGSITLEEAPSREMHTDILLKDDLKCSSEVGSLAEDPEVREVSEVEDKTELRCQEGDKMVDISSSNSFNADTEKGDFRQFLKNELPPCSKSNFLGEGQILSPPTASPSHSPARRRFEDSDYAVDKMERPSPVSVLEPLFTDDIVSPASTSVSQGICNISAEKDIQPRHIQFEEQSSATEPGICTRISLEDEESAFEYVEAVLLGSGLNWDEFLSRWLSSDEILDSLLFDEVELFSSRPRHDQKLLFDCANNALKEICDTYFRCFPSISDAKPNIWPMPKGMDLIQETWKQVEGCLFQHPRHHSLDQLIKIDLERSTNWIKLDWDVQLISFVIGETILDELVEDYLVMSLLDGTLEFPVLEAESEAIEDTI